MNYQDVFRVMQKTGMENDPAFADVKFLIQPIPMMDGCPLGLYVPERKDIILPPEFSPAALYHEIGHAYGDYHYHNLSEQYAESFRRQYMNNGALYVGSDFLRLARMGRLFKEGESGRVDIAVRRLPDAAELAKMRAVFSRINEPPPKVTAQYDGDLPVVHIDFTKGFDWFVIIGGVLISIIVADLAALAYAIYKANQEFPWILPLTLGAIASGFIIYGAYRYSKSHPGSFSRSPVPARR